MSIWGQTQWIIQCLNVRKFTNCAVITLTTLKLSLKTKVIISRDFHVKVKQQQQKARKSKYIGKYLHELEEG